MIARAARFGVGLSRTVHPVSTRLLHVSSAPFRLQSHKGFPIISRFSSRRLCSSSTSNAIEAETINAKPVAYWLFGVAGLVVGMVSIGGITRLTRSGLSMTDWKFQGRLPPMSASEWEAEFENYKKYPEWQQRKNMTIDEFKFIFFWEYGHRMFGRVIGLAYTLPLAYFMANGTIPRHLYGRMVTLLGLGGAQGLVGWWMVKSGLDVDPNQKKEIRVSPYRLATHLGFAFTTYTLLVWTGSSIINWLLQYTNPR